MSQPIHASCVARRTSQGWRGVLLTGPSGAGKTDMALRLIASGWRLVADDYCNVWRSGQDVYGRAPATIAGRIEVRSVGIGTTRDLVLCRLGLVCVCGHAAPERMWAGETIEVAGVSLPMVGIDVRPASAVQVVEAAMDAFGFQPRPLSSI